jgi:hypothetical protein
MPREDMQRAKGKGQRAKGKRQRAKGKGQKAKGKGQRAKGKDEICPLVLSPLPLKFTYHGKTIAKPELVWEKRERRFYLPRMDA